jgi:hypothetical protein
MPIISEYEQYLGQSSIPSDQKPEDQDIVKRVNDLLIRSKRHRKRYDADWHYNYQFVCGGKQWPMDRPRWRFSEVVNTIWASIMTEIALQTDARPKFEFSSQEWGDEAFVDVLKEVNNRNWDKYNWNSVVVDALFDAKLYHVAHAEVTWDPDLDSGLGDVAFRILDPFYCFWDPRASDVNKGRRARWFIYSEPVPTAQLKTQFPDMADKIKPDVNMMTSRNDSSATTLGRVFTNFDPYTPSRLPSSATSTGELYGGEPHTMLLRCWLRDDTMEQIVQEKENPGKSDEEALQKEYLLIKKFPKGRYIEVANNVKLRDCSPGVEVNGDWIEFEDDSFPVARLVNYQYPREYAGENECTHTKAPQKIQNYIWSYILDMFRMQANPVTILGATANVDEEEITNEPGNIINAADVNQVRREPGTSITPGSFELLTTATSMMDKVQGLQDVSRGAADASVNSALMMDGYIEAAQTRPRMKNRNLDCFLQDIGQLMVSRYLQFYTKPRVYRLTNKEGFPDYVEFYLPVVEMKDMNGQMVRQKVAKITRVSKNDGSQAPQIQSQQVVVKGCPDVKVISGSALPYAKAQKNASAIQLYTTQAIDREELLKFIDWPNYQEVLKRMAQAQQAAAQAQAQQAPQGK